MTWYDRLNSIANKIGEGSKYAFDKTLEVSKAVRSPLKIGH
jgi:hypothetical protein